MAATTTITVEKRRARLARRHFLAAPAPRTGVDTVAGDLVGLHSSDPVTVYLSLLARVKGFAHEDLEASLYTRKSLVRMLGMRRTMFVVPVDVAAVMDAACTQALAVGERKRLIGMVEEHGLAKRGSAWIDKVEKATLAALAERREATAVELTKDVPQLGKKFSVGEGKKWAGEIGMSTRLLFLLASEGRIVRGRPLGTWVSSQYRWAPTDGWLDGALPELDPAEARAELLRRWLRTFGPGTQLDIKWWTGWTVKNTKAALEDVGAVEVSLEGSGGSSEVGYVLPDDLKKASAPKSWVALLPGLDPTVMGWKDRDWYLDPGYVKELYDTNGNAGPTVWVDGRIVGAWTQAPDGEVVYELLQPVSATSRKAIDREATQVSTFLAEVRVKPRFPTPLEKRLRS
jgi:hypothetical protein